jgi:guanylate kinase
VGKGTLARELVKRDPHLWLSKSWTTRSIRPTETGEEYVFVDRSTFETAIKEGAFLEWAEFHGNLYGTPKPSLTGDVDVLLEIETQGAEQVLGENPDAVVFLILPPSINELEGRLRGRGDSEDHVEKRLSSTPQELEKGHTLASFTVINDSLDRATNEILSILEGLRQSRRNSL